MKIFKTGDYDWCAAETAEDARKAFDEFRRAVSGDEPLPVEEVYELSETEMDSTLFTDADIYEDTTATGPKRTFGEELRKMIDAGATFPCHFATTE